MESLPAQLDFSVFFSFLCATGGVALQCHIITTMFSVLSSHLTLWMDVAVMEFP